MLMGSKTALRPMGTRAAAPNRKSPFDLSSKHLMGAGIVQSVDDAGLSVAKERRLWYLFSVAACSVRSAAGR